MGLLTVHPRDVVIYEALLQGYRRLGEVIENVKFINGVREDEVAA